MTAIALSATFSALLIAGGHWFPWRSLLHRDLHRVEAYIYGCLSILVPVCVVLWTVQDWYAIALITACTLAAGLMTVTTKAIDHIADWRNQLHDMKARQDAESRAMSAHD